MATKKADILKALTKVGAMGAGAVVAVGVNKIPLVGNQKGWVRGLGKMLVGALVPTVMKQKPDSVVTHFCDGVATAGVSELASGLIPGVAGIGNPNDPDGLGEVGDVGAFDEVGALDIADVGAIEEAYAVAGAYDDKSVYGVGELGDLTE